MQVLNVPVIHCLYYTLKIIDGKIIITLFLCVRHLFVNGFTTKVNLGRNSLLSRDNCIVSRCRPSGTRISYAQASCFFYIRFCTVNIQTIKKVPVYRRDRACTIVCCTSRDNTGQIGQIKSDVQRVRVVLNCPDFDTPSCCNFAFTPNFDQVTPQHRSSDLRRFLFVFVIFFGFFFCPFRTNVYSMRVRVRTFLRACGFRAKTSDAYNNVRNNT